MKKQSFLDIKNSKPNRPTIFEELSVYSACHLCTVPKACNVYLPKNSGTIWRKELDFYVILGYNALERM